MIYSPGAELEGIVGKNVRGPFPSGTCFSFVYSDEVSLNNFTCYNDLNIAWTGDSINAWRSSNVSITNGVVDGNHGITSMGVQMEGSMAGVHGGYVAGVEVRNTWGCFGGYPANGLLSENNVCANPICYGDTVRGNRKQRWWKPLWTAGNNVVHGVTGSAVTVKNSVYFNPCKEHRIKYLGVSWEPKGFKGKIFTPITEKGGPGIYEIDEDEYHPKEQLENTYEWDQCGFAPPSTDCKDFPH